jgi:hypothetical protein
MLKLTTFAAIAAIAAGSVAALADGAPSMKDKPAAAPATPDFDIAFGGGIASDYVFRGISQSDRWPSGSAYTELRYNVTPTVQFYDAIAINSIDYPNRAAAEVDFYGGIRPTFDKLAFDFGYWFYWYPGGQLFDGSGPIGPNPNCTNRFKLAGGCNIYEADLSFWEVFGKLTWTPNDAWAFGANVYYSPSWLDTGADGLWAAGSVKYTLPSDFLLRYLPNAIGVYVSGDVGHYSFGQTKAFYGNIDLPDYTSWDAGLAFTYKVFTLDFRYYDTDLSRGDCNVLTADHTASFEPGAVSSINPSGLASQWCGAAFVAKLSFDLTVNTNLK